LKGSTRIQWDNKRKNCSNACGGKSVEGKDTSSVKLRNSIVFKEDKHSKQDVSHSPFSQRGLVKRRGKKVGRGVGAANKGCQRFS